MASRSAAPASLRCGVGRGTISSEEQTLRRMAGAQNYNVWLLSRAGSSLGNRVLDVGAGIGTFTAMAADACAHVVAVERDARFAEILRRRFAKRPNVSVVEADAIDLSRRDSPPFDTILCFNVLEHVERDDLALRALRELLAPDGRLLLLVPAHPLLYSSLDRVVAHKRRYAKRHLRTLLRATGFEIEVLRYVNPIGAVGWLLQARLLGHEAISATALGLYDRLVPALTALDRFDLPFGLSLWAVGRPRTGGDSGAETP